MLRGVKISLFYAVFCISVILPQDREVNLNLVYPQFIPSGSSFDVSLTITNTFINADSFELIIIPDNRISINSIEYKSLDEIIKLPLSSVPYDIYNQYAYKAGIKLDDSLKSKNSVFQLLINCKSELTEIGSVKLKGIFFQGNEEAAYLTERGLFEKNHDNFINLNLEFYKPQKAADKAIQFGGQSKCEFNLTESITNNLLFEFWLRLNDQEIKFLKMYRKGFVQPYFEMFTNRFQMLLVSGTQEPEYLKPFFAGKKSWYHISVYTAKKEEQIYFYCNGTLIAKYQLPGFIDAKDWKFVFENNSESKSFLLDLLRIVDFNNSIDVSFSNRHSIIFSADSSTVKAVFKFDTSNEFSTENNNIKIDFSGIKFVKSNSPLFAGSPELNIRLHSNTYELEWNSASYKQAVNYILEKSMNSGPFTAVFTVQADNTVDKVYTFIDAIDETPDVIYYRIKQNNIDGSVVYSTQVKVGQGMMESFSLGQNFPNPFNPTTSIEIEMFEDSEVEIIIYSLEGREIKKVFMGTLNKGLHKFSFDGTELPSGIYLYQVSTPLFSQTRKMILTK